MLIIRKLRTKQHAYNMDSAASKLRPRHRLQRLLNALLLTVPAFAKTLALRAAVVIM